MTKKRILIIDDDEVFPMLMSRELPEDAYEVSVARDGEEGLKKFDELKPNLVLLDMMMPKVTGIGFLKELRSRGKKTATPILVTSNMSGMEQIGNATALGVRGYIIKSDENVADIIKTIAQVFRDEEQKAEQHT